MNSKVLITSRSFAIINELPLEILKRAGYELDYYNEKFDPEEFGRRVEDCEVLIIGGHRFPEDIMKRCRRLKLICKHGSGVDNIPLDTAREMGIRVCNAPGTNSNAVADLTFGLILDISRKISLAQSRVRDGRWETITGQDVCFKTMGLLGFGAIARNVARRARGFSMKVMAYDPYIGKLPEEFSEYVRLCSKEELMAECDIVSAHLPLNEQTRYIISDKELALMKKGGILINTSRGGIVNEEAVAAALKSGRLAGAAFDVLEKEPLTDDCPLSGIDNVIITPHMGMYSKEAIGAVSMICAENAAALKSQSEFKFQVV